MSYLWKESSLLSPMRILFLFLLFVCASPGMAAAADDPYVSDPDYLYLYTAFEGENYIDCSSVTVDEYRPPFYKLEGDVVHVPHDETAAISRQHVIFKYNYKQQLASYYDDGLWIDVDALSRTSSDKRKRTLANLLFYAEYGIDFYH